MRTLTEYHNKHVLISGQGPIEEIGRMYVQYASLDEDSSYFIGFLDLVSKVSRRLNKFVMHFQNWIWSII